MLEAIVLGIIQGVTEFLPISSSGHLILIPKIFQWSDPGLAFAAILHLATGGAIVIFLGETLVKYFWAWCKKRIVERG
ncbi:MAG TPA: undecaprenyl-diphosphate phosphatase, partial [Patescibacteria group bacterium]|nr:undecaprenyl-diphosphate phosphatase [Patescibacteria group bacterium]